MSHATVLIVEDDLSLREALCDTLSLAGYLVAAAPDGHSALELLGREQVGMVFSDVQMQRMDGHSLLKRLKSSRPDLPVVLMTAYGTIQNAVDAMRDGAADYLVKPFDSEALVSLVRRYLIEPPQVDDGPVAEDPHSRRMLDLATRVAASEATVMISGPSGTGKEVLARYLHRHSGRAAGPFVAVNCAAIPENMLEAMLFGYEKGAFTGAHSATPGKFEQAQGGTLLLDEISEMSLPLQAKLLRVLQEREVERLGARKSLKLDVWVLTTSNRNLRAEVDAGRFREDLFYRLNVFPLFIHALRDRPGDILPLARRLLERHCPAGRPLPSLTEDAVQRLLAYHWPGNVRELENILQRALILQTGAWIDTYDLCFEIPAVGAGSALTRNCHAVAPALGDELKSSERRLILEALEADHGNRKRAAQRLGISPRTLRYKLAQMREAGLEIPFYSAGAESA